MSPCEKMAPSMRRSRPRWDVWVSCPTGDAAAAAAHQCYSQSGAASRAGAGAQTTSLQLDKSRGDTNTVVYHGRSGSFHPHPSPSPGTALLQSRSSAAPPVGLHVSLRETGEPLGLLCPWAGATQHQALLCQPAHPDPGHHSQSDSKLDEGLFFRAGALLPPASISPSPWQAGRGLDSNSSTSAQNHSHSPSLLCHHLSTLLSRVPAAHPERDIAAGCRDTTLGEEGSHPPPAHLRLLWDAAPESHPKSWCSALSHPNNSGLSPKFYTFLSV